MVTGEKTGDDSKGEDVFEAHPDSKIAQLKKLQNGMDISKAIPAY